MRPIKIKYSNVHLNCVRVASHADNLWKNSDKRRENKNWWKWLKFNCPHNVIMRGDAFLCASVCSVLSRLTWSMWDFFRATTDILCTARSTPKMSYVSSVLKPVDFLITPSIINYVSYFCFFPFFLLFSLKSHVIVILSIIPVFSTFLLSQR